MSTETTFKVSFEATVTLTGQQICWLLISALEGGSNYWCGALRATRVEDGVMTDVLLKEDATWEQFKPFHIRWWDCEAEEFDEPDENPEGWSDHILIDQERVNKALSKLYSRPRSFDIENYDADDGDAFFQFLLLEEMVYG